MEFYLNFTIFLATIAVSKHHLPASFSGGNCSGKMLLKKKKEKQLHRVMLSNGCFLLFSSAVAVL